MLSHIHRKTVDSPGEVGYALGQSRDIVLAVRLGRPLGLLRRLSAFAAEALGDRL